jgi:hypothetical protein
MKRSGIQGFGATIIPYSAMLHTGYILNLPSVRRRTDSSSFFAHIIFKV